MILQCMKIIVRDARFEPRTIAPEVWCATNEPPHHLTEPPHHQQWPTPSPTKSHHFTHNDPPHHQQWATSSPTMSYHITNNEPPHHQQWATTSPTMSHLITQWATTSPTMSHHIANNEPPHHQWIVFPDLLWCWPVRGCSWRPWQGRWWWGSWRGRSQARTPGCPGNAAIPGILLHNIGRYCRLIDISYS